MRSWKDVLPSVLESEVSSCYRLVSRDVESPLDDSPPLSSLLAEIPARSLFESLLPKPVNGTSRVNFTSVPSETREALSLTHGEKWLPLVVNSRSQSKDRNARCSIFYFCSGIN